MQRTHGLKVTSCPERTEGRFNDRVILESPTFLGRFLLSGHFPYILKRTHP